MGESKALEALFPGPSSLILSAMFGEPDRWWSLPELAVRAGVQPGSLRRPMGRLRESGLVRDRRDGDRVCFQPDPACPVYAELQSIVSKLTRRSPGGETILVVEDQPATAQITRILLESWGYSVLEAHGGDEAVRIFERRHGEVLLLLTDVSMPGMNGPELARELRRRKPELGVVFMSGYPNEEAAHLDAVFLPKPFNPASLSQMVRKALDRAKGRPTDSLPD